MKLRFSRTQEVEIELKRQPTDKEMIILLGKDEEENIFSLPDDLIDWDSEEVLNEDYSSNIHTYIPKPQIKK